METRIEFEVKEKDGKVNKLAIRPPQLEDYEEADRIYAVKLSSLIRDKRKSQKLLSRKEADEYVKEQKIWTEEDQAKVDSLDKDIRDIIKKIKKGGMKLSEGRELCLEITKKRIEILNVSEKRRMYQEATMEHLADQDKLDYLVYICTVFADSGQNYWESFEDMKADRQSDAYELAVRNSTKIIYGYDPIEFERNLPENKWLKKYGFINDELEHIDRKTGKKLYQDGKTEEEIEKETNEKLESLIGEIKEETPFIDDDTNQPVVLEPKSESVEKEAEVQTNV